jgi:hypothetical protein
MNVNKGSDYFVCNAAVFELGFKNFISLRINLCEIYALRLYNIGNDHISILLWLYHVQLAVERIAYIIANFTSVH